MSETPTTPAPMSAYRLARVHQIRQMVQDFSEDTPGRPTLARAFADLFADRSWLMLETVRLEARATEAEAQVAMLRVELAEQEVEKLALVKELGKAKQDMGYAAVKVGLLLGDLAIAKRNGPL